jgi:alginate O-acetyltransferase complex protein AlgI
MPAGQQGNAMVFHSTTFLFLFLPALLLAYHLAGRYGRQAELFVLLTGSLVFYAWWSIPFLAILLFSAVLNFSFAGFIRTQRQSPRGKLILTLAIALNLALLGYFKYVNFFIETINAFTGNPIALHPLLLPIGISFYTFQQIIYLVDTYNEDDEPVSFFQYLLFVVFFGYVTSGPITRQKEIVPQFKQPGVPLDTERLLVAVSLFAFGLFKKIVIADNIAPWSNTVFDAAHAGAAIGMLDAWFGATIFLFQLYFDFSGYCDMALALGYLFGIALPINFNSPLQARNAIEFWQRWHITLTRAITNYLYMPIAIRVMRAAQRYQLNKWSHFLVAVAFPLIVTFLIAGLWHGAGWTFVVFGLIWGVALTIAHAWRAAGMRPLPHVLAWGLTMGVAVLSMVCFRAPSFTAAVHLYTSMIGAGSAGTALLPVGLTACVVAALFALTLFAPNAPQIMRRFPRISTDAIEPPSSPVASRVLWQFRSADVVFVTALLLIAAMSIGDNSQFLYHKF